jgi:alpha-tubulin suppressor-like RCC1 family protein
VLFRPRGMSLATDPKPEPVAGISDAVAVATAGPHSLVLRSDGTILAWGINGQGQVGSEQGIDRRFPTPRVRPVESPAPVRDITSAVALAAGVEHSVAVLADGTVRTWGEGTHGVPGDGVYETSPTKAQPRLAPARVVGITNAVAVAASGRATLALLADGGIRAWGDNAMSGNARGVLGTGSDSSTATPLPVVGITNAVAIAAGSGVAAAVLADGTVRAWGYGYGPRDVSGRRAVNAPLLIAGIRDAVAVSPYMALLRDGTVREFGPSAWPWTTPKLSGVVAIESDHVNRLALLADGKLIAWGLKDFYPSGPVVRAELGAETARQCAARLSPGGR